MAAFILVLVVPDAVRETAEAATTSLENKQVKRSTKELEKRLATMMMIRY